MEFNKQNIQEKLNTNVLANMGVKNRDRAVKRPLLGTLQISHEETSRPLNLGYTHK